MYVSLKWCSTGPKTKIEGVYFSFLDSRVAMKHTYLKRKKGKEQSGKQDQHSSKQEEGQSPKSQQASRQASIVAKEEERADSS